MVGFTDKDYVKMKENGKTIFSKSIHDIIR